MAHSLHWLEAALFAPAFAILIVAAARERSSRRAGRAGGSPFHTTTKD